MNKRLIVINIYFSPHSFGGATIVAEEVSLCLKNVHAWKILVVTSHSDSSLPPYTLRRYCSKGLNIISINLPFNLSDEEQINNPKVSSIIEEIVEYYQPTNAHIHSIQSLGCGYFEILKKNNIKFIVTLHDCWWICQRQFMIASDGRYCFQRKVDIMRCKYCVNDPNHILGRNTYIKNQLKLADKLLAPSAFQRSLYVDNDFPADKVVVNKNGIRLPTNRLKKRPREDGKVVFAFIGGPGSIKGGELIIKAFNALNRHDQYVIYVVDAAQNAGTTWKNTDYWRIPGKIKFVPPYQQEVIDEFFAQVDILLFPSQWKESFGLTVREALTRNVWVIATDAGGVTEDMHDGINGTIIPLDGDYVPLTYAIQSCLDRGSAFWMQYENPFRNEIRGFHDQAKEIDQIFKALLLAKCHTGSKTTILAN